MQWAEYKQIFGGGNGLISGGSVYGPVLCYEDAEELQLGAGQFFFSRPGADVYSGFLFVGGYGSIYGMQRSCGAEVGFSFSAGSRRGVFSSQFDIYSWMWKS